MEKTDPLVALCDAGPVIHLDQLGSLDLLDGFHSILIPTRVWLEINKHRPRLDIADMAAARIVHAATTPSPKMASLADAFSLDAGEREALILAESHTIDLFLTDDAAARLAAESMGLPVHGTLGLLLRAIRRRRRSHEQVLELLQQIPQRSTMYISSALLESIITRVKNEQGI